MLQTTVWWRRYYVLLIFLTGLLLRGYLTALAPVLGLVRKDLGFSAVAVGMTTTVPVLCFGVFSFLAPLVAYRYGLNNTLLGAVLVLLVGGGGRLIPQPVVFFVATFLIGIAISFANVLIPVSIRQTCVDRPGPTLSAYSFSLNLGATLGALISVPLVHLTGWSWPAALGIWAVLTVPTLIGWIGYRYVLAKFKKKNRPQRVDIEYDGEGSAHVISPATTAPSSVKKPLPTKVGTRQILALPKTWWLLGYMGAQSLIFYTQITWLPTQLASFGINTQEAGFWLGIYNFLGLLTSLAGPLVANRKTGKLFITFVFIVYAAGALLILGGGLTTYLGIILAGLAQGVTFAGALAMIVYLYSPAQVAAASAVIQGGGYLVAAIGPVLVGVTRVLFPGWWASTTVLLGMMVFGVAAACFALQKSSTDILT